MLFHLLISAINCLQPPLATQGKLFVDTNGQKVHLHCSAWSGVHQKEFLNYGLENQPLSVLADQFKSAGFNCVRYQFSAQVVKTNPVVNSTLVEEFNPQFVGKTALEVVDAVFDELVKREVMIILDYHMLDAGGCCSPLDQNGGWSNSRWTKEDVQAQLVAMVNRYKNNPWVIGVDVRNEVRSMYDLIGSTQIPNPFSIFMPNWGQGGSWDWAVEAETLGNAVLAANPNMLIMIQGFYQIQISELWFWLTHNKNNCRRPRIPQVLTLNQINRKPINLAVPHRLVYSCHTYDFFYDFDVSNMTYVEWKKQTQYYWGDVADLPDVPFFLGEFGTNHNAAGLDTNFFTYLMEYIKEKKMHWAYWAFEGTYANPNPSQCALAEPSYLITENRTMENSYGLLNTDYDGFAYQPQVEALQSIMFTDF
ncbi:hypothetical protein HDV01_004423 [Terramyces sp. JEL0728]|nr:hypothetical protein HDV01_004423 [Terramyces sp. JEL0728]